MIGIATSIEHNGLDASGLSALGDQHTDLAGLCSLISGSCPDAGLMRGCRHQGTPRRVVDYLRRDMAKGATDDQTGPFQATRDLLTNSPMPARTRDTLGIGAPAGFHRDSHILLGTRLSNLATDYLVRIPYALTFIRLRFAQLTNIRGDLSNLLLINPRHHHTGRAFRG